MTLSRRALLGCAGLAGLAAAGCTDVGRERPTCVRAGELTGHEDLGGAPLIYEIDERGRTFRFDDAFHDRLIDWLGFFRSETGVEFDELRTYGSWTDGEPRCSSWHNAGRAFDLARLRSGGRDLMSARYDLWGGSAPAATLRRYWATAASLHHHFADVLTYLFDDAHRNHLHVDNGVTGTGLSTFRGGASRVQNHAVQAICTYVWGQPAPLDGEWAEPTRSVVTKITSELGVGGDLTDDKTWREFLRASTARF
ncbi:hypothetical protein [Microlunatus sp. GCM10028923]|uniref:hypothetical protein n=1 Tax=Microlunatus sp. GCM10028923 TaxID=3273400 RepID=UPI00360EA21C